MAASRVSVTSLLRSTPVAVRSAYMYFLISGIHCRAQSFACHTADASDSGLRRPARHGQNDHEFGISRKTGYKIYSRYREHGLFALTDRSRRPVRYANQLPQQVESLIVNLKRDQPHWGARKIRELLVRRLNGDVR